MATVEQLLAKIQTRFAETVITKLEFGEITLEIAANDLLNIAQILKNEADFKFEQLMDLCGVDYLTFGVSEWATDSATTQGFSRAVNKIDSQTIATTSNSRFAVVYHLLSITNNQRIRLRVFIENEALQVPSVINIWQSANWYEREAFDLFGITFDGHPDLRRILTDYGFVGHPFRKDFPLIGEVEMRYDAAEGKVIYEPVSIEPRTLVPKVIRHIGHAQPELTEAKK